AASCAAVPGTSILRTSARPPATGSPQATGTSTSDSGWADAYPLRLYFFTNSWCSLGAIRPCGRFMKSSPCGHLALLKRKGRRSLAPRWCGSVVGLEPHAQGGAYTWQRENSALMHLKSYEIDGVLLRTGAANFSASGLKRQDNDLILIKDAQAAAKFKHLF